jgi:hypothetical protein
MDWILPLPLDIEAEEQEPVSNGADQEERA